MPSIELKEVTAEYHVDRIGGIVLISAIPHERPDRSLLPYCSGYSIKQRDPARFDKIMAEVYATMRKSPGKRPKVRRK